MPVGEKKFVWENKKKTVVKLCKRHWGFSKSLLFCLPANHHQVEPNIDKSFFFLFFRSFYSMRCTTAMDDRNSSVHDQLEKREKKRVAGPGAESLTREHERINMRQNNNRQGKKMFFFTSSSAATVLTESILWLSVPSILLPPLPTTLLPLLNISPELGILWRHNKISSISPNQLWKE